MKGLSHLNLEKKNMAWAIMIGDLLDYLNSVKE